MKRLLSLFFGCTLLFVACKRSDPPAKEWFIVKGRLIDKCSGGPVTSPQRLQIYNEVLSTGIGNNVSSADGSFKIRCALSHPYKSVYFLAKGDSLDQPFKALGKNPERNGDTIDLGDIEFGFDIHRNAQFIITKFSASDTFYLGYSADSLPRTYYPIPPDGIVSYTYHKYHMSFLYHLDEVDWSWGIGKAAYKEAISRRRFNTGTIKSTICSPDTTKFIVN